MKQTNKNNLKLFLFSLLCIGLPTISFSQYYFYNDKYYDNDLIFELGAGIGAMNCITDIGGANSDKGFYINEIRKQNHHVSHSVFAGVMYQDFVGLRLEATWGNVNSADADITSTASLNLITKTNRNLSFRSSIAEIALLSEFHPLMLRYFEYGPPRFSPYVTAGVGWFAFNPQTKLNGLWVDLQPLRTEGQGFPEYSDRTPYALSQVNFPIGGGIRYELSTLFNVRLEFLHRILFTDYLDDASSRKFVDPNVFAKNLSPRNAAFAKALHNRSIDGKTPARRGNPNDNDSYMNITLKIGFALGRESR